MPRIWGLHHPQELDAQCNSMPRKAILGEEVKVQVALPKDPSNALLS
jgi:hypothetical protein